MLSMRPDPEIRVQKIAIPAGRRRIPALLSAGAEAGRSVALCRSRPADGLFRPSACLHLCRGRRAVLRRNGAVCREPEEKRDSGQRGCVPLRYARL